MKHLRRMIVFVFLFVTLLTFSFGAKGYDIRDVTPPSSASKIVYGYSGAGRELVAYRFGRGRNVLVAGFEIHGYEDNFAKDGGALVYTANELMKRLDENRDLITRYDWSIYVLPSMNPDGLMDGYSCDGPGRCTTTYINSSGQLVRGTGVDLNRSFPTYWERYTSSRNFNGSHSLAAKEAVALAQFVRDVKGTGQNICIDAHGWFQQIITSNGTQSDLYKIFKSRFPNNTYANCTFGRGYFTAYTTSLGYASCLFEFPSNVYSMTGFINSGYCGSFNRCILDLLKAYGTEDPHAPVCPARAYLDVERNAWYHEAVDYAIKNKIFNGVSDFSFDPNGNMTRAMLVTTLYRINESINGQSSTEAGTASVSFSDVPSRTWYTKAVKWAAANGIVTGYPDGDFHPTDYVTREQLAAIFYRYTKWCGQSTENGKPLDVFPDVASVGKYAIEPMSWAYGTGLVQGISSSSGQPYLAPKGYASRAQTATIIMRYLKQLPAVQ